MHILALELENTKSYGNTRVDFTEGVNAIVGHNGSGKSTILEAIGFALFDTMEYRQADFVREGCKHASITVTIASSVDDRQYLVVRRCGAQNQHYIFDPELRTKLYEGKADVIAFLKLHMGVNANTSLETLFKDAVGVPQGTLTAIFLETASDRKKKFERLLQVEGYKTAADKLNETRRYLQAQQQELNTRLAALQARLDRIPVLEGSIQQRQQELGETSHQVVRTETEFAAYTQDKVRLEARQQAVQTLQHRVAQAAQRQQSQQQQLRLAEAAQKEAEQARATVQQHRAGHDHYLAAQAEERQLAAQAKERQQLQNAANKVDKALAVSQNAQTTLARELATIARAEQTVLALAVPVQEQMAVEQALIAAKGELARLQDAQNQVTRLTREQSSTQSKLVEVSAQLAEAQSLEAGVSALENRLATLRQQADNAKSEQAAYHARANEYKEQQKLLTKAETATCPVCEQELTAQHRTATLARIGQQIETLRSQYKAQSTASAEAEKAMQSQQAELQQSQQRLRQLPRQAELTGLQQQIVRVQADLSAAQAVVQQVSSAPATIAQLEAKLAELGNPRQQSALASEQIRQKIVVEERAAQTLVQMNQQQQELTELHARLGHYAALDAALQAVQQSLQQGEADYRAVLTNQQLAEAVAARSKAVAMQSETLTQAQAEHRLLQGELQQVAADFDAAELQRVSSLEQQARSQLGALQNQVKMLKQQQDQAAQELAALRSQQQVLVTVEQQRTQLVKQEEALENVRGLLRQAGPYVTRALVQQISEGASQFFGDLMQDYTRRLLWTEEYEVRLEVEGRERTFAQLSGGEQMSAALSVRLALLREMSNIDLAFFDEPTANLDEARRDALARQILGIKGFRQLFVISHDDTFEQVTQNLIQVERVNGMSTIR